METLNKLEVALYNKFEYVERYFDWLVNFCTKFLKRYNYKGFIYIFGYVIEVK
jgi:hypothetical protein